MGTDLELKISNIPANPGIYQFKDKNGKIIYVGKAKNLRNRVRSYFVSRPVGPRLEKMISLIKDVDIINTDSEAESLILEMNLIKKLKPRYNVNLKDDKSYPYIVITNEPYPRVFPTRRRRSDGSKYFGPYTDVGNMRYSLKMLRDIFMIRNCNLKITQEAIEKKKFKICLEYHIKKCEGPCEGLVTEQRYNEMIAEIVKLLNGKTTTLINDLNEKMKLASENEDFEEAAILRNKILSLEVYESKQKVVSEDMLDKDIINYVKEQDDACVMILNVRDGKVLGKRHYYLDSVEDKSNAEMLERVLFKHYSENTFIPDEVYLPEDFTGSEVYKPDIPYQTEKARALRKRETLAEKKLWNLLRNRKVLDLKFRRQHPLGYYIVDFYCESKKLIIEIDGAIHDKEENVEYDKFRQAELESAGYIFLRFRNIDVLSNIDNVIKKIKLFITSPPTPLPKGEGSISQSDRFVHPLSLQERGMGGEVELPGILALEEWFSKLRDKKIKLVLPKRGEKVQLMQMVKANAQYMLDELKLQRLKREFIPNSVTALKRDLRLTKLPRRIECFDISHIQGTDTVASMVVFEDGRPKKNDYRKFKLETILNEVGKPDDFASMREVIYRRFKNLTPTLLPLALPDRGSGDEVKDPSFTKSPDLIVIDGGKGQLSSAVKVLDDIGMANQNVIGLAKRLEEVFIPGHSEAQSIPKTSSGLKLLQRVRDEAHRFAITFHRSLRDKRTLKSELEEIKGIGKLTAAKLLKEFGSVENIKEQIKNNYDEFEKKAGKKTAVNLNDWLKNQF